MPLTLAHYILSLLQASLKLKGRNLMDTSHLEPVLCNVPSAAASTSLMLAEQALICEYNRISLKAIFNTLKYVYVYKSLVVSFI